MDRPSSDEFDKDYYLQNLSYYYTFIIILFMLLSNFKIFNKFRWDIEVNAIMNSDYKCKNINNAFDNWSKPYLYNFKIIEFFFPKSDYLYCQKTIMHIFEKNNMPVLSSGSRIIFEKTRTPGFLRFSSNASIEQPYYSLVINFIMNKNNIDALTNDIRTYIINKNIHMTYHTAYDWNFSKEDIYFMFPEIKYFASIKKKYDTCGVFSNIFSEKYL
jgi:hypothetical protein